MKQAICILLVLIASSAHAQGVLSEHQKDSIETMVCNMEHADQDVRKRWHEAKEANDSAALKLIASEWHLVDSLNYIALSKLIINIGYPCRQLLGEGVCYPNAILIHWCKSHPE